MVDQAPGETPNGFKSRLARVGTAPEQSLDALYPTALMVSGWLENRFFKFAQEQLSRDAITHCFGWFAKS